MDLITMFVNNANKNTASFIYIHFLTYLLACNYFKYDVKYW